LGQELELQMERFQADLDKLSRDVSSVSKFNDSSKCDDYHQEVRRITRVLETADKEGKQINGRQVIFQHELTDFSRIGELKKTFEPFALLWPAVDQCVKMKQSIQEQPMVQLTANQITKNIQMYFQSLHKSTRNFKDGHQTQLQIATDFKNEVVEMREHIPLLTCLLNPGMKQRHWTKLS
jgi:dynein heavy chain